MKIDRILTGTIHCHPHLFGSDAADLLPDLQRHRPAACQRLAGAWGSTPLTALADRALTAYGINPVVHSLIIDGIFAGVGSVLVFLPIIVTLFFFLSILEDTGYMARVAFVMDKPLRKIGLSGRSFVPMLIGFGCSVPAIMATRTVSSDRDRKMTILLTPYMSCSRQDPHLRLLHRRLLPQESGAGDDRPCICWALLIGIVAALVMKQTALPGQARALCHGAAQLPPSHASKAWLCCCGKRPRTFWSGPLP